MWLLRSEAHQAQVRVVMKQVTTTNQLTNNQLKYTTTSKRIKNHAVFLNTNEQYGITLILVSYQTQMFLTHF